MQKEIPEDFDISSLAQISEGYSGSAILKVVKGVITARRVERLDKRPLRETEFINALSRQQQLYGEKEKAFRNFMADLNGPVYNSSKVVMNRNLFGLSNTMGLSAAREKKKKMDAGDDGGDKKKKKKKK